MILAQRMKIVSNIEEIAKLLNVKVNKDSGRVFLEMEVMDPVWKQRILSEWQNLEVKLVLEPKEE
jgi:hypothetical protein